ncbi:MAG TPA: hemolysin III family protein [Clostridiaceae bacterium]
MLHVKDPVSGYTHLFGAVLSVFALILLDYNASMIGSYKYVIAVSIFGASLILLYSASSIYHLLNVGDRISLALRKIDHMMIYILIAGTYTPICLVALKGNWRIGMLLSIWTLAFVGMLLKIFWFNAPRWLSTAFYLAMGWLVVIAFYPIIKSVPFQGVIWLALGGILYSIGGIIYATKWPPINNKFFGFHEIFHLFVLAGSFSHFWMVYKFILKM